jgi:ribonuclease D
MDLNELPPPTLVTEARGLERVLDDCARASHIAVDTEADSFFNFREKVCLVQVSVGERDYLLDPLAGLDLRPFGAVLADPTKTKIFHDGEFDILILKREWGFEFRNLFDTRIAEAALGVESPGLAAVLRARFGIELDKSMQRSDWSARPLSERQVRYARLDTRFLVQLMDAQRPELASRSRLMILEGECARLERLTPAPQVFNSDDYVKLKGARTLDSDAQSRLRELFAERQRVAEELDLPPFKVLGNDSLVDIARVGPASESALANIPTVSPKQARRLWPAVDRSQRRAREHGPILRPPTPTPKDGEPRLDELEDELHERLKEWRRKRAEGLGLDSALVCNRHVLARLAQRKPVDEAALVAVEGVLAWQVHMFGPELLDVICKGVREIPAELASGTRRRKWGGRR